MKRIFISILILIFLYGCESTKELGNNSKLIFAQVLFRHGARAPSAAFSNVSYSNIFHRGLGELTDRGFENSYKLGKFLSERYVKSGFLNNWMNPKEMYWRSVKLSRCLSTAATVGNAMFDDYSRHIHVPILTEEHSESLLNYDISTCYREYELIREQCPDYNSPADFKTWPLYEEFVANCLNLTSWVPSEYKFRSIETYMNEYKNDLPLPKNFEENLDKISLAYSMTLQWITGIGRYHDSRKMVLKFGNLVNTLIENVNKAWKCYSLDDSCKLKKFKVYSTQDWMLSGVLESFNVFNYTVGDYGNPEYNSMIIMELHDINGEPHVKFLYKKEEVTELNHNLIDVSKYIRNCKPTEQQTCHLEDFVNCCEDYRERVPGASCIPRNPDDFKVLNQPLRVKRFVGYE